MADVQLSTLGTDIVTALEALEGEDRLPASAVKELTTDALSNVNGTTPGLKDILMFDGENYANTISPSFKEVYNFTGVTITEGTIVAITGSAGAVPLITEADNATDENVAGIVIADITASTTGIIQLTGTISEAFINTFGMTAGNTLYLGSDGAYTDTRPTSGRIIKIGKVGVVAASSGSLLLDMPASVTTASDVGIGNIFTSASEDVTLDAAWDRGTLRLTHATPTLTIQPNATQAYPDDFQITVVSDEEFTVTAGTGVDLNGTTAASYTATARPGAVALIRDASDDWTIVGDTEIVV